MPEHVRSMALIAPPSSPRRNVDAEDRRKYPILHVVRSGIIGEFYFGTFEEISPGIDTRDIFVIGPARSRDRTSANNGHLAFGEVLDQPSSIRSVAAG
jgi:hypothetical protein